MANTYVFPSNADLQMILQDKLPVLTMDDPIFQILPIDNDDDAFNIFWEQRDNFTGLMNVRGLDGQPGRVQKKGMKEYLMQPGVYGDYAPISEQELTVGRQIGTWGSAIDISKAVMERQDQLLDRAINRLKYVGWTLVTTGTFSVPKSDGSYVHTDSFSLQTFTAGTAWSDHANSTPLADLRAMQLLERGHSVKFDSRAKLYLNRTWVNHMLANTNANDLGGKRVVNAGGQIQPLSLSTVNEILLEQDLPLIVPYDGGYLDDNGTFQLFVANGQGVLVGGRTTGEPVGNMKMVRNANNPNMAAGFYNKVIDFGELQVPRKIEVHMGANFGPTVLFPSALVKVGL